MKRERFESGNDRTLDVETSTLVLLGDPVLVVYSFHIGLALAATTRESDHDESVTSSLDELLSLDGSISGACLEPGSISIRKIVSGYQTTSWSIYRGLQDCDIFDWIDSGRLDEISRDIDSVVDPYFSQEREDNSSRFKLFHKAFPVRKTKKQHSAIRIEGLKSFKTSSRDLIFNVRGLGVVDFYSDVKLAKISWDFYESVFTASFYMIRQNKQITLAFTGIKHVEVLPLEDPGILERSSHIELEDIVIGEKNIDQAPVESHVRNIEILTNIVKYKFHAESLTFSVSSREPDALESS